MFFLTLSAPFLSVLPPLTLALAARSAVVLKSRVEKERRELSAVEEDAFGALTIVLGVVEGVKSSGKEEVTTAVEVAVGTEADLMVGGVACRKGGN